MNVNSIFTNCKRYNSSLNSHMMKNTEWGAVSYLAKSKYGRNQELTMNNSSSCYTGGGSGNAYITNIGQSTTGTIYGVYDMAGGAWEYVAAYIDDESSETEEVGSELTSASSYMKDTYSAYNTKKYGDAIYETSSSKNYNNSWYNDSSEFSNTRIPFLIRGGQFDDGISGGMFAFFREYGDANSTISFRPVLVVN